MKIEPLDALPVLPPAVSPYQFTPIREVKIPVLILGGGPAGLSAAIELGQLGVQTILVDDKARLGGKLVLQTHRFFGSINAVYAGTRGIEIASILEKEVSAHSSVDLWTNSTCLAVFSDKKVGILRNGNEYVLVTPEILLVATGAREKSLTFKGNTLPGVYGAGAFQTILNRDLIKPADRLFIVGGGNVGLIAGYHALQADIQVVGLVEAARECGGYRVHKDKLSRMGVPIYTGHTVVSANGYEMVESVTIARVDERFKQIPGTEQTFSCDTILVAVGLDPVNEFYIKSRDFGMNVLAAGDAEEIAEASAAIYSGKIRGLEIASLLGCKTDPIPESWRQMVAVLKSRPGKYQAEILPDDQEGVVPVIHCSQEIPCDPCSSICPQGLIYIDKSDIRHVPAFLGNNYCCSGCARCVSICPGLAITLVNYQINPEQPLVTIPYEFHYGKLHTGDRVTVTDTSGLELGEVEVEEVKPPSSANRTSIVRVQAPASIARKIAGIRVQEIQVSQPMDHYVERISDDTIVCRCERVTAGEIRDLIRKGYRDLNEIKTVTRAMMGACGSKTCGSLIHRLFLDEGVDPSKIMAQTRRPIFMEVPLGIFAGAKKSEEGENHE
jgi:NADPH-dependent 2,4-dienoyl-CoA reductase/sulfur reductase-like enzyme/Fe-S-cluster-containing hydrogenase component 2/bacterioferritin-associated ferredoxin